MKGNSISTPAIPMVGCGSKRVAEIHAEFCCKLLRPVGHRIQLVIEIVRSFGFELQSADKLPVVIQPADAVNEIVHLRNGVYPARHGKANEFHCAVGLNIGVVPRLVNSAALHASCAGSDIIAAARLPAG